MQFNIDKGDDTMLDANIKAQLKAYLEKLQRPIELVASLDDGAKAQELRSLLGDIAELSNKVTLRDDGQHALRPSFGVAEPGQAPRIHFACFNVESDAELDRLSAVATRLGKTAPISLRVNPDVDAGTHSYISTGLKENKFGIAIEDALAVYRRAAALPGLKIVGIDCHIGSQLTTTLPFADALERVMAMIDTLAAHGITLEHLDIGGGLGVRYRDEVPPTPAEYAAALLPRLKARNLKVYMEPGRAIAANAGVLLTRVEFLKPSAHKNFAVVDAAMNDAKGANVEVRHAPIV